MVQRMSFQDYSLNAGLMATMLRCSRNVCSHNECGNSLCTEEKYHASN